MPEQALELHVAVSRLESHLVSLPAHTLHLLPHLHKSSCNKSQLMYTHTHTYIVIIGGESDGLACSLILCQLSLCRVFESVLAVRGARR
jgi:hypothetical protein